MQHNTTATTTTTLVRPFIALGQHRHVTHHGLFRYAACVPIALMGGILLHLIKRVVVLLVPSPPSPAAIAR